MNRKERRAVSVKAEKRELARQQKKADDNRRMLESIRRFLQNSMDNPVDYIKTTNRIYLLRCLGCIMDSILYDVDKYMNFSDFDSPSKTLLRKITANLDELLKRVRDYSIRVHGADMLSKGFNKDSEYDDVIDVSYALQELMVNFLIYFIDPEDKWRRVELDKFLDRVVTAEAVEVKAEAARAELHKLYDDKLEMINKVLDKQ